MRPLHEQLRDARRRSGIEKGGNTNAADVVKWAEACGHEILIVPEASSDSVLARARDANERELRVASALLELLIEFRDDPRAADYLERDIAALGERLRELRDLGARTAS